MAIQTTQNAGESGDAVTKTNLTIVTATSVSLSNSAGMSVSHPAHVVILAAALCTVSRLVVEVLSW